MTPPGEDDSIPELTEWLEAAPPATPEQRKAAKTQPGLGSATPVPAELPTPATGPSLGAGRARVATAPGPGRAPSTSDDPIEIPSVLGAIGSKKWIAIGGAAVLAAIGIVALVAGESSERAAPAHRAQAPAATAKAPATTADPVSPAPPAAPTARPEPAAAPSSVAPSPAPGEPRRAASAGSRAEPQKAPAPRPRTTRSSREETLDPFAR